MKGLFKIVMEIEGEASTVLECSARPAGSAGVFAAKTDRFKGKQAKQPGMATPLFYV
ncbi:hypothetical protein NC651_000541 [Populus alba x Populus x berolinensis]|nr:hypothetical protein NC651_000541 [Populus alba x Populus x berolinensis]